jgi:hypothetical protein
MNIRKTLDNKKVKLSVLISAALYFWGLVLMQAIITAQHAKDGQWVYAILVGLVPAIFYVALAMLSAWIILRDFYINREPKKNEEAEGQVEQFTYTWKAEEK